MRTWIGGGLLAAATAGGLFFVLSGLGNPSHCGPCVTAEAVAEPSPCSIGACPSTGDSTVVEVVDVPAALRRPAASSPFVSFDEPPLAAPRAGTSPVMVRPTPDREIMQATFIEPIADDSGVEVAPRPRKVVAPGAVLLGSATDPF